MLQLPSPLQGSRPVQRYRLVSSRYLLVHKGATPLRPVCLAAPAPAPIRLPQGDLGLVLNSDGQQHFQGAVLRHQILPLADSLALPTSDSIDGDDIALEDLPQSYRTADSVAVYDVPGTDGALTAQAGHNGHSLADTQAAQLVVCKVSQYRADDGKVDWFKYAATQNEWSTFSKYAQNLQSRHLVQLLGCSQSSSSISIVSEWCAGGDLQAWMDGNTQAGATQQPAAGSTVLVPHITVPDASWTPLHTDSTSRVPEGVTGPSPTPNSISSDIPQQVQAPVSAHPATSGQRAWRNPVRGLIMQLARVAAVVDRSLQHDAGLMSLVTHKPIGRGVAGGRQALASSRCSPSSQVCSECGSSECSAAGPRRRAATSPQQGSVWPSNEGSGGVACTNRMTEEQVAHVTLHVLRALVALHQAGLTHGDVKPANVFISCLTEPGTVRATTGSSAGVDSPWQHRLADEDVFKLGDFGTLREKGRQHLHYFVSGFGYTPEYASPEALQHGTARAGFASDLWSLGIMMQQMLLGRLPATALAMARLHEAGESGQCAAYLRSHPPACAALRELADAQVTVSPALEQVLRMCLQVSPKRRPADAMELVQMDWFSERGCAGGWRACWTGRITHCTRPSWHWQECEVDVVDMQTQLHARGTACSPISHHSDWYISSCMPCMLNQLMVSSL